MTAERSPNEQHPPANEPREALWARIKRHKVVEWALAYVAFGYALLHTVEMLGEAFEWPLLVPRLTVFGLVLGAPVAVTLAWYHGHRARSRVSGPELSILIVLLLVAGTVMWWLSRNSRERVLASPPAAVAHTSVNSVPAVASFNPPPHSIAVLPFIDMSEKHDQAYFSDGLTEELLNSLSRINALQVAARTSSFSFAGEHPDIPTVAHKLNVGAVLEGSVRRSGHTIRVTTQLISAVTGFHLWSETYDRDLGNVLRLQTEIATAVAIALKVTLLGDEATKMEAGGTHNAAALDAYLRTSKAEVSGGAPPTFSPVDGYTQAIRLDPDYALAYAARSIAYSNQARGRDRTEAAIRADLDKAQADATKAIVLAPDLGEGYLARAVVYGTRLEFKEAGEDLERALALAPGNARILRNYSGYASFMGHQGSALTAVRRVVALDPLNPASYTFLSGILQAMGRYPEALAAMKDAEAISPGNFLGSVGQLYYLLGDLASARSTCEQNRDHSDSQFCLALAYDKLGRHAEAEAELKKLHAAAGDSGTYAYAQIYAQWGNRPKALEWLEAAMRARTSDLTNLKTDPLMDPLRQEPRFQAIERELKFPD